MLFLLVESRDSSVVTFSTGLEPPVSNSIAFSMRLFARAQLSLGDKSSSCSFRRVVDESLRKVMGDEVGDEKIRLRWC